MKTLLVVYDNGGYTHWFPQGLAYVAAVLRKAGHEVHIYNQDMHHYSEQHLTDFINESHFDAVGISIIAGYYQYRKLLKLSQAINNSKSRPLYILGGHGPAPEPQFFFKKTGADVIIIGEGEETIVELAEAYDARRSFRDIKGIAFKDGDKVIINERRALIKNIDSIPLPAYDLFPVEYYRLLRMPNCSTTDFVLPMLSGRGCPFTCTFCYRMDEGFRPRSSGAIIDEIQFLKDRYRISYVAFGDELLMSSVDRAVLLCEDFIRAKINIKWDCNGRLNYATPELLRLMKRAGCVFINYGIESMDNQVLKNMKKALNVDLIHRGIENTLAEGISPGLNIIFGNIGDNRETLDKGVKFLLKYDDGAQLRTIRPVTPYPGSELYYHAIKAGLLRDCEDFYENKHCNSDLISVNFTELSDEEFYEALYEANLTLMNNYYTKKQKSAVELVRKLYIEKDISFRGFRQT